jgi:sugar lactone lactonase YvrE
MENSNEPKSRYKHSHSGIAGMAPNAIAFDPSGKFAYATNGTSNTVTGYTINAVTGSLTPPVGRQFHSGN